MIHYIYKIINILNKKTYIGYTSRNPPELRWKQHLRDCCHPNKKNRPLYRAFEKYGQDKFSFEVIYCSKDGKHTLKTMENYFINDYNSFITESGYNLTKGGESNLGWTPSDETRQIWSSQRVGRKLTEEHKNKLSNIRKQIYVDNPELKEYHRQLALAQGRRPPAPTPESQKKSGVTRTGGHIHSEERKKELSELAKQNKLGLHTDEAKEKRKETWKTSKRNVGSKNGNAVFGKIFSPTGELVAEGYLRDVCEQNNFPFNKFLAASRHGNPLQRGPWKGWKVIQT